MRDYEGGILTGGTVSDTNTVYKYEDIFGKDCVYVTELCKMLRTGSIADKQLIGLLEGIRGVASDTCMEWAKHLMSLGY